MQRLARPAGRSAPRRAAPPGQAEYQTGLALADQGQWKAAADAFARAVDC
jgi:TolA-binding protein